jgi:surface protein
MKKCDLKNLLLSIELGKVIDSPIHQLPDLIAERILYFTYSYYFNDSHELKQAVNEYPSNIKKYGNISNWNVSYITNMSYLFANSKITYCDLRNWNVSNVTNMGRMFSGSNFIGDIRN